MAKICAVVMNSVTRDARVLREAASLINAGHEVIVVGIQDKNYHAPFEITANGVKIYRVKRKNIFWVKRKNLSSVLRRLYLATMALAALSAMFLFMAPVSLYEGLISGLLLLLAFSSTRFRRLLIVFSRGLFAKLKIFRSYFSILVSSRMIFRLVTIAWPFFALISKLSPNVVHCHDVGTLPIGVILKYKLKCHLIYDAHEIYEEVAQGNPAHKRWYGLIHRFCQKYVDSFITINESIANWYAKNYDQLPKAVIIMNATKRASVSEIYDGRLHAAAELSKDAKVLLYQGGFATHRGLKELVLSAKYLPANWFLVMMGWGSYEDELRAIGREVNAFTEEAHGYDAVRFIPPAPQLELVEWSSGATVGIIPYENVGLNHWFCTPNKLWEYPNAGVPLLVSPFPEMRRQIEQYSHGWLLPEKPSAELIAKIICKLTDFEISFARARTADFMANNHWGTYEERLLRLYGQIENSSLTK